jgi:hypothetical protein
MHPARPGRWLHGAIGDAGRNETGREAHTGVLPAALTLEQTVTLPLRALPRSDYPAVYKYDNTSPYGHERRNRSGFFEASAIERRTQRQNEQCQETSAP